jgi:hypothetical protein
MNTEPSDRSRGAQECRVREREDSWKAKPRASTRPVDPDSPGRPCARPAHERRTSKGHTLGLRSCAGVQPNGLARVALARRSILVITVITSGVSLWGQKAIALDSQAAEPAREQSDTYKVEVFETKKLRRYEDGHGTIQPAGKGNILLAVELRLYKDGKRFDAIPSATEELLDALLVDNRNQTYRLSRSSSGETPFRGVLKGELPDVFFDPVLFFSIPEQTKGLKLRYRNAPIIDLKADKIAVVKQ